MFGIRNVGELILWEDWHLILCLPTESIWMSQQTMFRHKDNLITNSVLGNNKLMKPTVSLDDCHMPYNHLQ